MSDKPISANSIQRFAKMAGLWSFLLLAMVTVSSYYIAVVHHDGDGGGIRFVCGSVSYSDPLGSSHTFCQTEDAEHPTTEPCDALRLRQIHGFSAPGWKLLPVAPRQAGSKFVPKKPGVIPGYGGQSGWHMEPCGTIEGRFGRIHPPGRQCRAWRRHTIVCGTHLPLFLLGIATIWLWYPDLKGAFGRFRSPGPHFCKTCGYCLSGNISGICPECGSVIPIEQLNTLRKQDIQDVL